MLSSQDCDSSLQPLALSVILPVHNEESTVLVLILSLYEQLSTQLTSQKFEIIVVNDGSTDQTSVLLCEFLQEHAFIPLQLIEIAQRKGLGNALRQGTQLAGAECVCWIDADGTYSPLDLIRLFRCMHDNDQIIGSRSLDHGSLPRLRFILKRATSLIVGWLWRRSIPDLNSGLRIFTKKSAAAWLPLVPAGFSCSTTATLGALQSGHRVVFLPIQYFPRAQHSVSKFRTVLDSLLLCRQVVYLYSFHCRTLLGACGRIPVRTHLGD